MNNLEDAAKAHRAVHESTGYQSKRLRDGWRWRQADDSFGLAPTNLATGEQCRCNERRWVLDRKVLICTTCFADCT